MTRAQGPGPRATAARRRVRSATAAAFAATAAVLLTGQAVAGPADAGAAAVAEPARWAATAHRRVVLDASACPAAAEAPLRRFIAIELGDLLVDAGQPSPIDGDRLVISCDGDLIRVEAVRRQRLDRTFKLSDFPDDAGPRALALAALEALAALSPEVRERLAVHEPAPAAGAARATGPAAPTVAAARTPAAAPRLTPAPAAPTWWLGAAGVWRAFSAQRVAAWGGKLTVDHDRGGRWTTGGDLELARARDDVALGGADSQLGSVGGFVGLRGGGSELAATLALGARAGVARLAGEPAAGSGARGFSVLRAWAGLTLAGRVAAGSGRLGLAIAVEGGVAAIGARGLASGGSSAVAASGAWVAVSVGAGYRF